jgi:hypothetical protein
MHSLNWWRTQGAKCTGMDGRGIRQAFADLCDSMDWTAFTTEHWEAFQNGAEKGR